MALLPSLFPLLTVCVHLASRPCTLAAARKKNTHHQRQLQTGTLTIQARRNYRRLGTLSQDCPQNTPTDTPESLEVSFAFLPNNPQNPRIAVNFHQRLLYEGSFLKKPALSISALLPHDSEVFHLIEEGDLSGLIQLLSLREASLTDRDRDGRCLLHVSINPTLQCGGLNNPAVYSVLSIPRSQIFVDFS